MKVKFQPNILQQNFKLIIALIIETCKKEFHLIQSNAFMHFHQTHLYFCPNLIKRWDSVILNALFKFCIVICSIQVLSFFSVWSYDKRNHINQCIFSMEIGKFEVSYYDGSFFSFFLQSLFVEVVPQVETYSILHKVWIFMEEGPHQLLQICLKRNLSQLLLLLSI